MSGRKMVEHKVEPAVIEFDPSALLAGLRKYLPEEGSVYGGTELVSDTLAAVGEDSPIQIGTLLGDPISPKVMLRVNDRVRRSGFEITTVTLEYGKTWVLLGRGTSYVAVVVTKDTEDTCRAIQHIFKTQDSDVGKGWEALALSTLIQIDLSRTNP